MCNEALISNGKCDGHNNHLDCSYDGGDCCKPVIEVSNCQMNKTCYCHYWMQRRFAHFVDSYDPYKTGLSNHSLDSFKRTRYENSSYLGYIHQTLPWGWGGGKFRFKGYIGNWFGVPMRNVWREEKDYPMCPFQDGHILGDGICDDQYRQI